nr:L-seryl-tRNA(Sec) selenium transferase [Mesobacillus harenae]
MPPVHELQKTDEFHLLMEENEIDFEHLTIVLQQTLDDARERILQGSWNGSEPGQLAFIDELFKKTNTMVKQQYSYTLKKVINATGTILHTNLGRARLSDRAVQHVADIAQNYSNLEYKIEEGERGSRHTHIENLLKKITGAEAAMVVNNNAAAVFLVLKALAQNKEVIVSRGQLVEIGGSFRISSIMEESGAKLVDIGTTNKTHLYDYEKAITDETAMILKVHTSNFKVIGFTKSVETEELSELASRHDNVIFYEDLGSGVLYDYRKHGIGDEPVVGEVLKMGADVVSFSGDKLLGGPQAGIIAGKKKYIDLLKKHQLARIVRVDKMTLAALEGTLLDYLKGEKGLHNIPAVRDLLTSKAEIKERTERFINELESRTQGFSVSLKETYSQVGGGTMPDVELPTWVAAVKHHSLTAEQLSSKLRNNSSTAIIARIHKEEIHFDLRTVGKNEQTTIISALKALQSH